MFAGRDASRGLAMFSVSEDVIREEYDDLSDLNSEQMERVREWEQQLSGLCHYISISLRHYIVVLIAITNITVCVL